MNSLPSSRLLPPAPASRSPLAVDEPALKLMYAWLFPEVEHGIQRISSSFIYVMARYSSHAQMPSSPPGSSPEVMSSSVITLHWPRLPLPACF